MTDRRNPAGPFFATDQVLEGATLRDRFLTAFVLRNAGFVSNGMTPRREAACIPVSSSLDELGVNLLSFDIESPAAGNRLEPLRVATVDQWFLVDEEDDM